jgi:hypothetical protein
MGSEENVQNLIAVSVHEMRADVGVQTFSMAEN